MPVKAVQRLPVRFKSVEQLLNLTRRISSDIRANAPPTRTYPFSPFTLKVRELALLHLRGQYPIKLITDKLLEHEGKPKNETERKKMRHRVFHALELLKKRQEVPQTSVHDKPEKLPKLREATPQLLKENEWIIHKLLARYHPYMPPNWRKFISHQRAVEVGKVGLRRGIELFDPEKRGSLQRYAELHIIAKITGEVKRKRKEVSLEAPWPGSELTPSETLASGSGEHQTIHKFDIKRAVEQLIKTKAPMHRLLALSLYLHGHSFAEIGRGLGMSQQGAYYHYAKAIETLKKAKGRITA